MFYGLPSGGEPFMVHARAKHGGIEPHPAIVAENRQPYQVAEICRRDNAPLIFAYHLRRKGYPLGIVLKGKHPMLVSFQVPMLRVYAGFYQGGGLVFTLQPTCPYYLGQSGIGTFVTLLIGISCAFVPGTAKQMCVSMEEEAVYPIPNLRICILKGPALEHTRYKRLYACTKHAHAQISPHKSPTAKLA